MSSSRSAASHICLVACLLVAPAFAAVNIDYVTVGDVGNSTDPTTGNNLGAVSYVYQIAKTETTNSNYVEFLNAVAKSDPYSLYHTGMSFDPHTSGIARTGSSGSYSYSVMPGMENKPVGHINWFDAARFSNWLHNGQQTGVDAALTAETGAYNLEGATSGIYTKNTEATVWIPSADEWYKAAYYDPNRGGIGVGGYWAQATQRDVIASNIVGTAGGANYFDSNTGIFAVTQAGYQGGQIYLSDVGAYGAGSESAYGTRDQAGNVWEWNDGIMYNQGMGFRGMWGGGWFSDQSSLTASTLGGPQPEGENSYFGFRVASIPEPSVTILISLALGLTLFRRHKVAPDKLDSCR